MWAKEEGGDEDGLLLLDSHKDRRCHHVNSEMVSLTGSEKRCNDSGVTLRKEVPHIVSFLNSSLSSNSFIADLRVERVDDDSASTGNSTNRESTAVNDASAAGDDGKMVVVGGEFGVFAIISAKVSSMVDPARSEGECVTGNTDVAAAIAVAAEKA